MCSKVTLSYTLEEMCADDPILSADFNRSCFIRGRMKEVEICSGTFKIFEGKFGFGPGRARKILKFRAVQSFTGNIMFVLGNGTRFHPRSLFFSCQLSFHLCFTNTFISLPSTLHSLDPDSIAVSTTSNATALSCFCSNSAPGYVSDFSPKVMLNTLQAVRLSRIKPTFISAGSSFCRSV